MKKISSSIIVIILGLIFTFNASYIYAQASKLNRPGSQRLAATDSGRPDLKQKKEDIINKKIEDLKERAIKEIDRRITSLTNAINRISEIKRLTDAQKSLLINDIQAEIDSLTALKAKIQAETDPETLRADIKSIVTSYRIYLLYLPVTRIIVAADVLLNTADKMSELSTKLQTRIDEAKAKGEDVSSMETLLADMKTKIDDAKTQANNAINTVTPLKPTDYPGNKPELQKAREILQTAKKDLITAKQDAQKIIVELRKLNKDKDKKKDDTLTPAATTPVITSVESEITPTDVPSSTQITE